MAASGQATSDRLAAEMQSHAAESHLSSSACKAGWHVQDSSHLVERLQFVRLHWCLVLMQVSQGILRPVMVSIVVSIDGLRFQPGDRVKLFDCCSTQSRQGAEYRALYLLLFREFPSVPPRAPPDLRRDGVP